MQVQARIDTRADEPQVRMSLPAEIAIEVAPPTPLAKPEPAEEPKRPEEPRATQHSDANVQQVGAIAPPGGPPLVTARAIPNVLPSELVALIRKPGSPLAKPQAAGGPAAIHGAFAPGQVVVYVLDCSGSMGAGGKFDAARAALVATLQQQPATVRFQVIVYAGGAKALLASDGALPATEANVRAAAEKLAALDARGASNHREALRAAVAFRPDVILLLTDADDLSAAALKPVLAAAQKPVSLCVGLVAADGVRGVRELK